MNKVLTSSYLVVLDCKYVLLYTVTYFENINKNLKSFNDRIIQKDASIIERINSLVYKIKHSEAKKKLQYHLWLVRCSTEIPDLP